MSSSKNWWKLWAPYWERLEDRHLSTVVTDTLLEAVSGPVLVVGAGQGLIVERLRKRGLQTEGVDLEPEMVAWAERRRGIKLTLGDAANLPFPDGAFRTVIVATGVMDYLDDEALIARIVAEGKRVLGEGGELIMTFYKLPPRIARINRRLGVLTPDGRYRLRRIFEIMQAYRQRPMKPVRLIADWRGCKMGTAARDWLMAGVTLPASMRQEQREMKALLADAVESGGSEADLIASVPESLPYREEPEVLRLMDRLDFRTYSVLSAPDCTVIRHHRSPRLDAAAVSGVDSGNAGDGGPYIIRTEGLTKVFASGNLRAVDGLTIRVKRGTIYGILGPNGAGKTTTLGMLCGLIPQTEGEISFSCGLDKRTIKKDIGYVPQKLALYERLSAMENLRFFAGLYGVRGGHFEKRSAEVLEITGLTSRAREPISNYSGGMLRRLNLAAGLLHEPKIILLDEPTVGIDPQSRNRIFDAVKRLREEGVTVLYTTHYMEEAMTLCDTIAIVDHGKVVMEGPPSESLAEMGLSEIQFLAERAPSTDELAATEALDGVRSVTFSAPVLTVRAKPNRAGTELIQAVQKICVSTGSLTLKCFVEPTLERLFLDITGRTLRDEKERS